MFLIKNNLNQPLTVCGKTLPSDGQIQVLKLDDNAKRLAEHGFVSIQEAEKQKPKETK